MTHNASKTRKASLEVCYRNPHGVSVRCYGTDLDFDIKKGQSDPTTIVIRDGILDVAEFPTTDLIWARLAHK